MALEEYKYSRVGYRDHCEREYNENEFDRTKETKMNSLTGSSLSFSVFKSVFNTRFSVILIFNAPAKS